MQLLSEQIEQLPRGVDRRRDAVAFDPGDRRLARSRPGSKLRLGGAMAQTRFLEQLADSDGILISDQMYRASVYSGRWTSTSPTHSARSAR
jgi:hypothetical protein